MQYKAKITGIGKFLPERVLTNFDLEEMMDTSDEWIQQRTGIKQRYWAAKEDSTSGLALHASEQAIKNASIDKSELDMIIFATLSPDHDFPGTGCFLQSKLGVPGIPAFDIRQQCSGFIYGLSMAQSFIEGGQYKNILIVGSEIHSKTLDKTPRGRNVSVLFGDASGAAVVSRTEASDTSHLISTDLHSDGDFARELWIPAPGNGLETAERLNNQILEEGLHYPKMNGKTVFIHACKRMAESMKTTLEREKLTVDDCDLFLFHQANLRINQKVGEILGIPEEKIFNTIHKYGNTTAATIPLGMFDALEEGVLKRGMLVGMASFGSGFTWGSALLRY